MKGIEGATEGVLLLRHSGIQRSRVEQRLRIRRAGLITTATERAENGQPCWVTYPKNRMYIEGNAKLCYQIPHGGEPTLIKADFQLSTNSRLYTQLTATTGLADAESKGSRNTQEFSGFLA